MSKIRGFSRMGALVLAVGLFAAACAKSSPADSGGGGFNGVAARGLTEGLVVVEERLGHLSGASVGANETAQRADEIAGERRDFGRSRDGRDAGWNSSRL